MMGPLRGYCREKAHKVTLWDQCGSNRSGTSSVTPGAGRIPAHRDVHAYCVEVLLLQGFVETPQLLRPERLHSSLPVLIQLHVLDIHLRLASSLAIEIDGDVRPIRPSDAHRLVAIGGRHGELIRQPSFASLGIRPRAIQPGE